MKVIELNNPFSTSRTVSRLYVRGYSASNHGVPVQSMSDLYPVFTNNLSEAMVMEECKWLARRIMNRIISLYDYDISTIRKTKPRLVDR